MNSSFEEGYEFGAKIFGAEVSAIKANGYVDEINNQIDTLEKSINDFYGDHTPIDSLKGKIAEVWHANTYNIDAALKGIEERATVLGSNEFGSIDIQTDFGKDFGLKYHANPENLMKQQAKSFLEAAKEALSKKNPENRVSIEAYLMGQNSVIDHLKSKNLSMDELTKIFNDPIYERQFRLVPADKFDAYVRELKEKIAKELQIRPEQADRYIDTLNKSVDRIRGPHTSQSIPLSEQDACQVSSEGKDGKFDVKEYGISAEELIKINDILREGLKAGVSAAVVYCALKIAPNLIKMLKKLASDEGVTNEELKELGVAALSSSGQGFFRGMLAASLTITFKAGLAGELAKKIDPFCIGVAVTLLYDTLNNAIKMSSGKMTKQAFYEKTIKQIFVTIFAYSVGYGSASLFIEIPPLSGVVAIIGNLVGAIIGGFLYDNVHSLFLSFCAETGYTFFGLVDQDYSLPEDVLKGMDIDLCDIDLCEGDTCKIDTCEFDVCEADTCEADRIQEYYISRGVIGINKIGYIIN